MTAVDVAGRHLGRAVQVLIVDDSLGDAHLAVAALEQSARHRYDIVLAETVHQALASLAGIDLVLLDVGLPDATGLDGLDRIRAAAGHVPIVMLTGDAELPLAEAALQAGAQDYLLKDELDARALERTVEHARARHELLRALEASERWAQALVHSISDVVTIHRSNGELAHIGGLGATVLAPPAEAAIGALRHLVDRPTWRRMVRAFGGWRRGGRDPLEFAITLDGSERHYESVATNLLDHPLIGGIVVTSRDVTERHHIQRRLSYEATHDPLTGLGNRTLFTERLEAALASARTAHRPVAVLLLDLDDFKKVNDSFGHAAGDEVLRSISALLSVALREHDTLARIGGDEFVVVCPDAGLADAERIARRLEHALLRPFSTSGRDVHLTASIGIAVATGDGATVESLLRDADLALYESKGAGKATVRAFSDELEVRAMRRMEVETELHGAIARGELEVRYQPIVDLSNGAVVGHEALLRWRHPVLGDVEPEEMIRVAEESGLIVPIGRWVLDQVCQQISRWRHEHHRADFHVSVNVSARQLADPAFVTELAAVLDRTDVPPAALCLEVTETAVIGQLGASVETLQAVRSAGLRIALDDFGTGYSSLTYLRRLPVDVLKVDRSFTSGIASHADDRAVVGSVVRLAWALGVDVVAEGVEDVHQRDELRRLGCRLAQGFLWSPAVPAARAGALLGRVFDVGEVEPDARDHLTAPEAGLSTGERDAIALVAHELMQPLTVIQAFADSYALLEAEQDPRSLIEAIARNAGTALTLVRSLADAGALERGTLQLDRRPTGLAGALLDVVGDLRRIVRSPIEVEIEVEDDAVVALDVPKFRQIITNLLQNAAKFAPPGTPVVVQVEQGSDGPTVSVVDSGPGVPPEREHELFRRFGKLGRHHGTGLGLYVARRLARLHGGDLTYRRADTGGARFTLHLPRHDGAPVPTDAPPATEPAPAARSGSVEALGDALAATSLHRATRALLRASHPEDVVGAAIDLTRALGGKVVPAAFADAAALPLDLAMGEGPPLLPTAPPLSIARLRLEAILPLYVEDGRDVLQRLRNAPPPADAATEPDTGLRVGDPALATSVRLRSALAVVDDGDEDGRVLARLVRSVADEGSVLLRWRDGLLVVAVPGTDGTGGALRDQLVAEWLRWGGDRPLRIGAAEGDGTEPPAALIDRAIADLEGTG